VICAGTAVAVYLSAQAKPDSSAAEPWWWVAAIGAAWLSGLFYMINRGYGRTLLTPEGMKFHTFTSRRSITWSKVSGIERKSHATRSGEWWEVRVQRVSGRPLAIPGVFTARRYDPLFERNLAIVREYWSHAQQRPDISGRNQQARTVPAARQ